MFVLNIFFFLQQNLISGLKRKTLSLTIPPNEMNVSIVNNPIKVVLISGTFSLIPATNDFKFSKSVNLETRISFDYLDIRNGTWNVCLKDICFQSASSQDYTNLKNYFSQETENQILALSTNLVDGKFINKNNSLQLFYPPLQRFPFKLGLKTFEQPCWLTITSATPSVELYMDFFPIWKIGGIVPNFKCDITVTLLFQRLQ